MSDNEDEYPSPGEQNAFSDAHKLMTRYLAEGVTAVDIGRGFLVAAMAAFRKGSPDHAYPVDAYTYYVLYINSH